MFLVILLTNVDSSRKNADAELTFAVLSRQQRIPKCSNEFRLESEHVEKSKTRIDFDYIPPNGSKWFLTYICSSRPCCRS